MDDSDWAALDAEDATVAAVLDAVHLLLGETKGGVPLTPEPVIAELKALSVWGASDGDLARAQALLEAADLGRLLAPKPPGGAKAAVALAQPLGAKDLVGLRA